MPTIILTFYFKEHFYRILYCFFYFIIFFQIYYYFKNEILYLLLTSINYPYFIFHNILDLFLITITITTLFSCLTIIPLCLLQYFLLKKTNYTKLEKYYILNKLIIYNIYYILLNYTILIKIAPTIWNFLLTFEIYNQQLLIELTPQIIKYIYFIIYIYFFLLILHGILFISQSTTLLAIIPPLIFNRHFVYPIITIIFSTITPPDLLSLLLIIIPFFFIYEYFLFQLILQKKINEKDRIRTYDVIKSQ